MNHRLMNAELINLGGTGLDAAGTDRMQDPARTRVALLPLVVESAFATSAAQPVSIGVPFPRGVLRDLGMLSLSDSDGSRKPLQAIALGQWPDRSVKWVLLDFVVGPVVAGRSVWALALEHE